MDGSVPPHTYGTPRYFLAALITASPVTPPAPAAVVVMVEVVAELPFTPDRTWAKAAPLAAEAAAGSMGEANLAWISLMRAMTAALLKSASRDGW